MVIKNIKYVENVYSLKVISKFRNTRYFMNKIVLENQRKHTKFNITFI